MAAISTVKIQDGDDYAIINERDFDPGIHQIYVKKSKKFKKTLVSDLVSGDGDSNGDGVTDVDGVNNEE
jgi:hypothetical protein